MNLENSLSGFVYCEEINKEVCINGDSVNSIIFFTFGLLKYLVKKYKKYKKYKYKKKLNIVLESE